MAPETSGHPTDLSLRGMLARLRRWHDVLLRRSKPYCSERSETFPPTSEALAHVGHSRVLCCFTAVLIEPRQHGTRLDLQAEHRGPVNLVLPHEHYSACFVSLTHVVWLYAVGASSGLLSRMQQRFSNNPSNPCRWISGMRDLGQHVSCRVV